MIPVFYNPILLQTTLYPRPYIILYTPLIPSPILAFFKVPTYLYFTPQNALSPYRIAPWNLRPLLKGNHYLSNLIT